MNVPQIRQSESSAGRALVFAIELGLSAVIPGSRAPNEDRMRFRHALMKRKLEWSKQIVNSSASLLVPDEVTVQDQEFDTASSNVVIPNRCHQAITAREFFLVALTFVMIVACQLRLTNSMSLFHRQFWLDEFATQYVVHDSSLQHALQAVKGGVDTNPPVLHLLLRLMTVGGQQSNEETLRSLVLVFALFGILGTYALLRKSFPPLASFAGGLAVWSHPLLIHQAFEARFYGAWFACTVWYAYFLIDARKSSSAVSKLMLALFAGLVCTIHYFGVIAWGLVTLFEIVRHPGGGIRRYLRILPAAIGPIALAVWLPFLVEQRAVFTVSTWVSDPTPELAKRFLIRLLFPAYLRPVVVFGLFAGIWYLVQRRGEIRSRVHGDLTFQAGILGLTLLPLVLIAFSFTVQSVLVDRYGIPAIATIAPVVAYLTSRVSRAWVLALCAYLIIGSGHFLGSESLRFRTIDANMNHLNETIRTRTGSDPVVFERVNQVLITGYYAPDIAARCFYLDFETDQIPDAGNYRIMCRDLIRQFARFYQTTPMMNIAKLQDLSRFYLVVDGRPDQKRPQEAYPGFAPHFMEGQLYEMTRIDR